MVTACSSLVCMCQQLNKLQTAQQADLLPKNLTNQIQTNLTRAIYGGGKDLSELGGREKSNR